MPGVRGSIYATVPLHSRPFPAGQVHPNAVGATRRHLLVRVYRVLHFKTPLGSYAYKGLEVT